MSNIIDKRFILTWDYTSIGGNSSHREETIGMFCRSNGYDTIAELKIKLLKVNEVWTNPVVAPNIHTVKRIK